MSIFKCKICGGDLSFEKNESIATCDHCGTMQTLPRIDSEKKANLYDRANHFRRSNEYDKATNIYEQLLEEDRADSETYWSLVLCRFGVEYVEDPVTHKRIPTVNRTQYTSIFDDENYRSALKYADSLQRDIYEKEAKAINEIQKGILAISQNEEPFDVFICYKETDNNGRRTPDSVLANELYHELVNAGYKVFFSRITLEDKLGTAYEPYIFAALNSAKVMVVLGTRAEHFNAVWVKNEWSRYLALIKQGQKKILIPAYKDMDPYDLPEEFSHLQAQDMSKLGFMQDLIRGIEKLTQSGTPKANVVNQNATAPASPNTAPLLKRAFMFLEDGDFAAADEYCEKVLDIDPENARAYLGKLMAELKITKQDELKDQPESFDKNKNYLKAVRFGDNELKSALTSYIEHINKKAAVASLNKANTEKLCDKLFEELKVAYQGRAKANSAKSLLTPLKTRLNALTRKRDNWDIAQSNIEILDEELNEKRTEMSRLERERDGLGFFTSKRKKQISQQIIGLTEECSVLESQKKELSKKNSEYESLDELLADIKDCEQMLSTKEAEYEKLSNTKAINELTKQLEQYEYGKKLLDSYWRCAEKGNYIKFGKYKQKSNGGKEDIEWLVLDVKCDKALVISKYALDCKKYNEQNDLVTWQTCTLRKWLNREFFNTAFSDAEKSVISAQNVIAYNNTLYDTNAGASTEDKMFLLSINEAKQYFYTNQERTCTATEYALERCMIKDASNGCWWWLRSPGESQTRAARVSCYGIVEDKGNSVNFEVELVRPAMWLDLDL